MIISQELKDALSQVLWQFKAPIRYAFAYGSGVFPQSKPTAPLSTNSVHPHPPAGVVNAQGGSPKVIDFIFGVTSTDHWHSLNLRQNRHHYSLLGAGPFGTWQVSKVQEAFGAGVYFNPYVVVNGITIKYGVVNIDTLVDDLANWNTMYIAGRLHKPVKILRDSARVRYANQLNITAALRTALLLLPPQFTERELYGTVAGLSYMGDPRMSLPTEDPGKVSNIVGNNITHFRRLYEPLIKNMINVDFNDPKCNEEDWVQDPEANVNMTQDMDPVRRANMVRRLPKAFRSKLYFQYQSKYQIPQLEFNLMMESSTNRGGDFERRIVKEELDGFRNELRGTIKKTIWWPSAVQSVKGLFTAGIGRSYRYMKEKREKHAAGVKKAELEAADAKKKEEESGDLDGNRLIMVKQQKRRRRRIELAYH
jgi:translocator assembly and maintenance protein 41